MLATMQSSRRRRRRAVHGFTLPELLISMAILAILTLALFMLFRSSLSAYKSTKKSMEANEETHTAFRVLQRDLVQNYAAKHYGDSANFFGCPYGMTMICTMEAANVYQYRSARVSYVVNSTAGRRVVDAMTDAGEYDVDTQTMIRFIEPGVNSLSEYPVNWPDYTGAAPGVAESPEYALWEPLNTIYRQFGPDPTDAAFIQSVPTEKLEAMIQAKKHELWLAMLGQREEPFPGLNLPTLWDDPDAPGTTWGTSALSNTGFSDYWDGKYAEDYIIAEGVMQTAGGALGTNPAQIQWFLYGFTPRGVNFVEDVGDVELLPYWNAVDRANLADPGDINYPFINLYGSPLYPYPPSLVATKINMAFTAPNLGEHHYTRRLEYTFQIPVGYRRPTLE